MLSSILVPGFRVSNLVPGNDVSSSSMRIFSVYWRQGWESLIYVTSTIPGFRGGDMYCHTRKID